MANDQDRKQDPATESDISKAQSQQQPLAGSGQQREPGQFETGEQGQSELGQRSDTPDEGLQGDTLSQQRTDVEGANLGTPESGEAESGFVGSKGEQDSSSELVDEEDDQRRSDGE